MTKGLVTCAQCGEPHDIAHIEPSLRRPDAVLEIPSALRPAVVTEGKDFSIIWSRPHPRWLRLLLSRKAGFARYFLRVMLPFRVDGRQAPVNWGVWVETDRSRYRLAYDLWESPEQNQQPPFAATLASAIEGYPSTIGLRGKVQLESPSRVPTFILDPAEHLLYFEQRAGVSEADVLRWLDPILHE